MNLTEISIIFRKLLIFLALLFLFYLFGSFLLKRGKDYWRQSHPSPPPSFDTKFGLLPTLNLRPYSFSSSGLKFTLENIEGRPPEATSVAKVYPFYQKKLSILSLDQAKNFAVKLGFREEPETINPLYYRFLDSSNPAKSLILEIANLNFELRSDYSFQAQEIFATKFSSKNESLEAENYVKTYIRDIFDQSLQKIPPKVQLLDYDIEAKTFFPVEKPKSASVLKMYFFRENIEGLKVLPPKFDQSFNYVLYTPSVKILEISYTFWPILTDNFGLYPLRSSQKAWQDLVDGYGFVVKMGNNSPEKIIIREIYLAYLETKDPQEYLQPVFVFEGDNDFVAYVPAILEDYLK